MMRRWNKNFYYKTIAKNYKRSSHGESRGYVEMMLFSTPFCN